MRTVICFEKYNEVIFSFLGDASASLNEVSKLIDNRISLAFLSDDPNFAIDLRTTSKGRPGNTFDDFYACAQRKISEQYTAVDDRRHGVAHMSQFISIR